MESNVQQDTGANVTHDQSVRGESPVSLHDLPSMNSEMEQEEESWLSGFISSIVRPLSRRQSKWNERTSNSITLVTYEKTSFQLECTINLYKMVVVAVVSK